MGFAAGPDYWKGGVFAYVGLPQNLKDLKDLEAARGGSARWTRQLSSRVTSLSAINFKALCGANMVTLPADIRGDVQGYLAHKKTHPPRTLP